MTAAIGQLVTPSLLRRHRALLLLICLPLLVHLPALLGFVHADESLVTSGIAIAHSTDNPGFGAPFIDGNAGGTAQALGHLVAQDWLHGIIPWWNPYAGVGMPLAAEMQPMAFFLPFVLLLKFAHGLTYLKIVLQVLAGLATYAALRERGLGKLACCVAGVLFEMNGTFAWFGDAPMAPLAFLPVLIWGIERTRHDAGSSRVAGMALVVAGIVFSLTSGFPQTAFIDGLLAGVWALEVFIRSRPVSNPGQAGMFAARLGLAGLLGLCLSAPALIPFNAYLGSASLGSHVLGEFGYVALEQIPAIALPYLFGPILQDGDYGAWGGAGGFVDICCLFLATLAITVPRPGAPKSWLAPGQFGLRAALGAWALFCLLAVCGERQADWIRHVIPLIRLSTFHRYAMASISFAAIVLAAFTIDDWVRGQENPADRRRRMAVAGTVLGIIVVAAMVGADGRLSADWRGEARWMIGSLVLACGSIGTCAYVLSAAPDHRRQRLIGTVLSLQALLLFTPPILAFSRKASVDMAPIDYLKSHLGLGRVYAMGDSLRPNYGSRYGIAMINYFSVPVPANWSNYMQANLDPVATPDLLPSDAEPAWQGRVFLRDHHAAFEQAGVTHALVTTANDPLENADPKVFQRVFRDDRATVYRLTQAAPYFETRGAHCTLLPKSRERLVAVCDAPAKLIRRELMFDNWSARVNGHRARLQTTDDIFQQIDLPAGRSDVVFRYVPPWANTIAILFAAGLVGMVGLLTMWWRREAKPSFLAKKDQKMLVLGSD